MPKRHSRPVLGRTLQVLRALPVRTENGPMQEIKTYKLQVEKPFGRAAGHGVGIAAVTWLEYPLSNPELDMSVTT